MTMYNVIGTNEATGEKEFMDWTYNEGEAYQWCKEYATEDNAERSRGVPVPPYSYTVEPMEDEEDEEAIG